MNTNLRRIANCLAAFSALLFTPLVGCLDDEANPSPVGPAGTQQTSRHFRLGPFYGYDSLRHYEYTISGYAANETSLDSLGRYVTEVGYLEEILTPGPDTIRLRVGTRRSLVQMIGATQLDTSYDTLYANSAYIREGIRFRALDHNQPIPFLDWAYVTDGNTHNTVYSDTGSLVDNLENALQGAPAQYTHTFVYGYAGGGGSYGSSASYRQGVGMTSSSWRSGINGGRYVALLSAKP